MDGNEQKSRRKSDTPTTPVKQVERDIQATSTRTGWSFQATQEQFGMVADLCMSLDKY